MSGLACTRCSAEDYAFHHTLYTGPTSLYAAFWHYPHYPGLLRPDLPRAPPHSGSLWCRCCLINLSENPPNHILIFINLPETNRPRLSTFSINSLPPRRCTLAQGSMILPFWSLPRFRLWQHNVYKVLCTPRSMPPSLSRSSTFPTWSAPVFILKQFPFPLVFLLWRPF